MLNIAVTSVRISAKYESESVTKSPQFISAIRRLRVAQTKARGAAHPVGEGNNCNQDGVDHGRRRVVVTSYDLDHVGREVPFVGQDLPL